MLELTTGLASPGPYWAIEGLSAMKIVSELEALSAMGLTAYGEGSREQKRDYQISGRTAIIPIVGAMVKRPAPCSGLFGEVSTIELRNMVRAAAKDSSVDAIVLVLDSPGGEVNGTSELAADIAQAGIEKRIVAFIDGLGASAAYWVAASASAIYAGDTSLIGSIGVFRTFVDSSASSEKQGLKVHVIGSGSHKGAGVRGTVITDEMLDEFQRNVDTITGCFVDAVSMGRGFEQDKARELADGRLHVGSEAVDLDLIDGITSLDKILSSLSQGWDPRTNPDALAGASAPSPERKPAMPSRADTPMNTLENLKAFFSDKPEAATAAGITLADLDAISETEATPVTVALDPAVEARMKALEDTVNTQRASAEAMANTVLAGYAESRYTVFRGTGQVRPAQHEDFVGTYVAALKADGGVQADGSVSIGAHVERVERIFANAPKVNLTQEEIANADPTKTTTLEKQPDPEERERILNATSLGKRVSANQNGGN